MVSGKYSALAGAVSREQAIANIANNLANVNTTGYKKMMVSFESILQGSKQATDANGINYNRIRQTFTDFSPGPVKETGNTYDLAIHGSGFFKVLGPEGPLYTRNGAFHLDGNGALLTQNGYPVLSDNDTPIEIPQAGISKISINSLGAISSLDEIGNREEVGQIALVNIDDPAKLKRRDNTLFELQEGAQEVPLQDPQIVSGGLEVSNVNMIDEMTRMINGHRLYETYHKVLKGYSTISEQQEELGTVS